MLHYLNKLNQTVNLDAYKDYLNTLRPFQGKYWYIKCDQMKNLKKYIRDELEKLQHKRCAYCGLEYTAVSYTNIEHIAPKHKYSQFMFEPLNLTAACPRCNGFEKKGNIDTVKVLSEKYKDCEFTIVHPYLDNPDDHFTFVNDNSGIIIQAKTPQGEKSIEIFKLDDVYMAEKRAEEFRAIHTLSSERKKQIDDILSFF